MAQPPTAESDGPRPGTLPPERTIGPAPFLRAPDASRGIFLMVLLAACGPLAAGVVFFGWRALLVTGLSIGGCVAVESLFCHVRRSPAMTGRSHAALTGLLLALTLPAFAPWYVPLTGAVFAVIVGKALFGGVGHFLWQPALVGRLAVAVIFAPPLLTSSPLDRGRQWPVLAQNRVIMGDVTNTDPGLSYRRWRAAVAPDGKDAIVRPRPRDMLRRLTRPADEPPSMVEVLQHMPPAWDLIVGAHGGGIGETCALVILVAGLYLGYRNYLRPHLPCAFLLAAAATAAVAPIRAGDGAWQWLPLLGRGAGGAEYGFIYVSYHLLCGEIMLAAWFLATEMTSRPVTVPGQVIFGVLCGVGAVLARLYLRVPIPAYGAVLVANTFTPLIDATVQPRVLGQLTWWRRLLRRR